jgi:hypothetical protein
VLEPYLTSIYNIYTFQQGREVSNEIEIFY